MKPSKVANFRTTELRLSISAPQTLCVRSALTGEDLGMATLQPEMTLGESRAMWRVIVYSVRRAMWRVILISRPSLRCFERRGVQVRVLAR